MPRILAALLSAAALAATTAVNPITTPATSSDAGTNDSSTTSSNQRVVERIAGTNRYATAAILSEQWPSVVDRVYVASGQNFPDALIAAARAGVFDSPVLLTQADQIPSDTAAALVRLQPKRIVVLGGTETVSAAVAHGLQQYSGSEGVDRVAGGNRYETTALIAEQYSAGRERVFLASGEDYPDALAAAAVAGAYHQPLLLTRRGDLPEVTAKQLSRLDPDEVIVVGGVNAVSASVAAEASTYTTTGKHRRVSGADRYQTAAAVAAEFSPDLTPGYVASGADFADALVAGGMAAKRQVPVVLTPAGHVAAGTTDALDHLDPSKIYVVGGPRAVSEHVVTELADPGTSPPPEDQPAPGPPPGPPPAPAVSTGAYNGMGSGDDQDFQDLVGGFNLTHASSYYTSGQVGQTWPDARDRQRVANGTTLLIGMASKNWNRGGAESLMAWSDIAAGEHDAEIRGWGQALAELDGPVWFAFDIEPDVKLNQGQVPEHWRPSDFAAAAQRISTIVRSEATNVKFTFWVGGTQKDLISQMYPGDDYVDIICWDPYVNKGRPADTTPLGLWSEFKTWLDDQPWGKGKTIGLCETGYHNGHPDADGARFWEQAPAAAEELGLSFVTYFHRNSGPNGNYTMEDMPLTRKAYAAAMQAMSK